MEEKRKEGDEDEESQEMDGIMDELPEGDEGWEYIDKGVDNSKAESTFEESSEEDFSENELETEEEFDEDELTKNGFSENELEPEEEEESDDEESDDDEIEPTKTTVTEFVRRADSKITSSFSEGDVWKGGEQDRRFVELGWIREDGTLTERGASILCYASDIVTEAGGEEAAIAGYLNSQGVKEYIQNAVERGPDEGDDGLLGGFLGS